MILLVGMLIGCALTLLGVVITFALYLLHRPRYVAPTKHNRKWRDLPTPPVQAPWEREEVGGIEYRFMGTTGFEE
jgi:hypothetical protein